MNLNKSQKEDLQEIECHSTSYVNIMSVCISFLRHEEKEKKDVPVVFCD